jgi:AAA15 family ATPase/GTPase
MFTKLRIQNFRSIVDIEVELGRVNFIIGANGSGKTNFLEAIAFAAAAESRLMANKYFSDRGIRTTPKDSFPNYASKKKSVKIELFTEHDPVIYRDYSIIKSLDSSGKGIYTRAFTTLGDFDKSLNDYILHNPDKLNEDASEFIRALVNSKFKDTDTNIAEFIIYDPNISDLKRLEVNTRIQPIDNNGNGFVNLLLKFDDKQVLLLNKLLSLFEWFGSIKVHKIKSGPSYFKIFDRFNKRAHIEENLINDGFWLCLFCFTVLIADKSPHFFSIEHLENGLNPRLCKKVSEEVIALAKQNDKQILVSTHSPFILDGCELYPEDTKIIALSRGQDGRTLARSVSPKFLLDNGIKPSEGWLRGYFGGLPNNFD